MSQEDVEVVRRALEAYNRADRAALPVLFHPDVEFRTILGPILGVDTVRGRNAVLSLYDDIQSTFDDVHAVVEGLTDLGNGRVLVEASYRGRAKQSGVKTDEHIASVYAVGRGLILSVRDYASRQEALEAVGLSE